MSQNCLICSTTIEWTPSLIDYVRFAPIVPPILCLSCQRGFQRLTTPTCPDCGRQQLTTQRCHDCNRWQTLGIGQFKNRALYVYNDQMQAYMQAYKFKGDYRLRQVFQPIIQRALQQSSYDLLVTIPVSAETWRHRGFNQVTGWLTTQEHFDLMTVQDKTAQSTKDRKARMLTPQPFTLIPGGQKLIHQRKVLLLDDIYTTGRTIRHAAQLLLAAGARQVTGLTLAR